MPNMTSTDGYTLSTSPTFLHRLSVLLDAEAMVVLRELGTVPNHATRATLATNILFAPDQYANTFARELVFDTNIIGAGLILSSNVVVDSLATDAAIRSQIATNWNVWCGIPQ